MNSKFRILRFGHKKPNQSRTFTIILSPPEESCEIRPIYVWLTEVKHGPWLISDSSGIFFNLSLINMKWFSFFWVFSKLLSIFSGLLLVTFSAMIYWQIVLSLSPCLSRVIPHNPFRFHLTRAPFPYLFQVKKLCGTMS